MNRRAGVKAVMGMCAMLSASACRAEGPGMIVNFSSTIEGRSISIKSVTLPDGSKGFNPGSFGGRRPSGKEGWRDGKAAGFSGDHRQLPEWVEFEWSEPSYPGLQREHYATREEFRAAVMSKLELLPLKSQRVEVRHQVPQAIVDEAMQSRVNTSANKVPDKLLWLYFVWTEQGVKFRWRLSSDTQPGKEGGEDLS